MRQRTARGIVRRRARRTSLLSGRAAGGPQEIGAEVGVGVAPDGVDVVCVVLRVVVLDENLRPLEAVVVRPARPLVAPAQAKWMASTPARSSSRCSMRGEIVGKAIDVRGDQAASNARLAAVHVGGGEVPRGARAHIGRRPGVAGVMPSSEACPKGHGGREAGDQLELAHIRDRGRFISTMSGGATR